MRSVSFGLAVVSLAIASFSARPDAAQQPAPPPVPNAGPQVAGGRGPNPFLGLAGWVDSPTSGPDAPRFEVASVKRNKEGAASGHGGSRTSVGGVVRTTNATLRMLIRTAYRLGFTDQIVGGPSWIDSYGFDVDARPVKPVTVAESALMLRTMLAERFRLEVRKESREGPVYALVLARRDGTLGPQIKPPSGACVMEVPGVARAAGGGGGANLSRSSARGAWPPPGSPGRRCGIGPDGDTMKAGSVTMSTLITSLTPLLDRPIVDRTGLTGLFDFDLRYAGPASMPLLGRGRGAAVSPDTPSDPAAGPSIFTALQEQLGLRLDSQRGSVDVLAVLRAELPAEN